jgi:protein disulfide-isomerase A1
MKTTYVLLLLCGLFLRFTALAVPTVLELNKDTFDVELGKEKLMMVEFYAPWCGHCKKLAPEYEKAVQDLGGLVKLAKVDCTVNEDICNRFGVRGYPTIKIFHDQVPSEYTGDRTAEAIVRKMRREALPPITFVIEPQQIDDLLKDERVVVVGFFQDPDQEAYKVFEKVAQGLRSKFLFAAMFDRTVMATTYQVTQVPYILLLKTFDERQNVFEGAFTPEDIESFVQTNSIPLMDDITPENFAKYQQSPLPLAYLFIET